MNEIKENNISRFSMDQRLSTFRNNKKTEDYLMVTITLASLIFFSIFIIRPSIVLIIELNKRSLEYKELSRQLDEKINNLEQIIINGQELRKDFALLNTAITDIPNEAEILNNINFVAQSNNIQISNVNFTFDAESGKIKTSFNALGTYQNTVEMFSQLKNLLTPFIITSVNLKPRTEYGENIINLVIEGESYYLK